MERSLERPVALALDQLEARLRAPVRSRLLRVRFPAADTPREVVHGMDVDPSRLALEVLHADAPVCAARGRTWVRDVAWLETPTANVTALVRFSVIEEEPIDA